MASENFCFRFPIGASACAKLGLYDETISWCDKGLAVSLQTSDVLRVNLFTSK